MKKFIANKKNVKFISSLKERYSYLSQTERLAAHIFFILALVSILAILLTYNNSILEDSPRSGGTLSEGIVGVPRFINPLYAERDVDRDLTKLVYSGLTRRTPQGNLIPDLAESWEINPEGTQYTFTLRENAYFHDGEQVTSADVVFTIEAIQDSATKSPFKRDWDGVVVEALNDKTVIFSLPKAFTPFIQNTTIGILPEHIWSAIDIDNYLFHQDNLTPTGSGPYEILSTRRSPDATNRYTLVSFKKFHLGAPFIQTLTLFFYNTEEELQAAYANGTVSSGIFFSDESKPLVFSETISLFFNQSKNSDLQNDEVRQALYKMINTEELVQELFPQSAEALKTFIPSRQIPQDYTPFEDLQEVTALEILDNDGWDKDDAGMWYKKNSPLEITIATADNELLIQVGQYLVDTLREEGVQTRLEIFSADDLLQQVIRPRNFEVLLFGQQINHGLDLYGFWHSSQRNDPGLNIAQYTNLEVNDHLESLRTETDPIAYQESLVGFLSLIEEDLPGIPLFARSINYTLPEDLFATTPNLIVHPSERFNSLFQWHKEKDSLWKFLR